MTSNKKNNLFVVFCLHPQEQKIAFMLIDVCIKIKVIEGKELHARKQKKLLKARARHKCRITAH